MSNSQPEPPHAACRLDAVLSAIMAGHWSVDAIVAATGLPAIQVLRSSALLRRRGLIGRRGGAGGLQLLPVFRAGEEAVGNAVTSLTTAEGAPVSPPRP